MPRIEDHPVTPKVPSVFGDDRVAAADDDPVGIGTHLHRAPHRRGHHRVAVAVKADQASAGDRVLGLVKAVERRQHRLQRWQLHLQSLGDGHVLLLGVRLHRRPATALGFQPFV